MTPDQALSAAYDILPAKYRSAQASVLLLVIQRQENPKRLHKQVGGPAVGDYQFEIGGGITGVLEHEKVGPVAVEACKHLGVTPTAPAVYRALQLPDSDVLAAVFARLFLYTDPNQLPLIGDAEAGWECYLRTWRPGAVKRQRDQLHAKWRANYEYVYRQL